MLTAKGAQLPVRLTISSKEGPNDKPLHVVAVEKSSWEEGMDERRLSMRIDDKGTVEELVSGQDACACMLWISSLIAVSAAAAMQSVHHMVASPELCRCGTALQVGSANPHLYGFKPANLVGCTLSHFVDALEPYASTLPELVTAMVTKAAEKPGLSWRVGIHPPWEPGCSGMSVTQVSKSRPSVESQLFFRASAAGWPNGMSLLLMLPTGSGGKTDRRRGTCICEYSLCAAQVLLLLLRRWASRPSRA